MGRKAQRTHSLGLPGVKWKDTGKKCHSSDYGDAQTHSAHTDGGAKRKGTVWYNGLEDDVKDAGHKEQQGPCNVNFGHRCFLKSNRGKKRNSAIFKPIKHPTGVNTLTWKVATTHIPRQERIPRTRAALLRRGFTCSVDSPSFCTNLYLA